MLIFTPESAAENELEKLYQNLCKSLEISDLGFLSEFLGIELHRPNIDTIYVTQHGYVRKMLTRYNKGNLKPRKVPLPTSLKLLPNPAKASAEDIK
jgi:hypothetical protein